MFREDYLMKMVQQLAEHLAKIVKLRDAGELEQALAAVDEGLAALFGDDLTLLQQLDPLSAARMLSHPERKTAYAKLLEEEAIIYLKMGEIQLTERLRKRAKLVESA